MNTYKKSFYNILLRKNKGIFLYNTLNQSCIELTEEEYLRYKNLELNNEEFETFKNLGLIVDKNVDERSKYLHMTNENKTLFVRILTTTACNAKCEYCYEKGAKIYTIDKTLADKIIDKIIQTLKCNDYRSLHVQWFGGEPLLNVDIITYISKIIKKYCESNNYRYFSTIVTNGSLINDEIVQMSVNDWNVIKYQITIDGLKKDYEKIKKYKFKNGFDIVMNNIKKLANANIKVSLRLNYSKNNYQSICDVIKFLKEEFNSNEKISVYAFHLFTNQEEKEIDLKIDKIVYKCLIQNGFYNAINSFTTTLQDNCVAVRKNNMVINANGDILKCSRAINDDFAVVGNIEDSKQNLTNLAKWEDNNLSNKCKKCKYLPICGGGCKFDKIKGYQYCPHSPKLMQYLLRQSL